MHISHLGRDSKLLRSVIPDAGASWRLFGVSFPHGRVSQLWMAGPVCVSNPYGVEGGLPPSGRSWARQAGPPHNRISPPRLPQDDLGTPYPNEILPTAPLILTSVRISERAGQRAHVMRATTWRYFSLPALSTQDRTGGEGQSPARRSAYTHSGPREAKKHARIQHKHARQQLPLTHTNLNQINSSHGHSRHSQHG